MGVSETSVAGAVSGGAMRKVAFASAIGTIVEWYDFFIYATASALVFNKLFFPNFDPLIGSLVALTTYAAGFFARPVGGLVFGYVGDRYGRKGALVTTLLIVGIATFVVGLMPSYNQIGIAAPIMLLLIRLLHGFGVGGEQGNAILITCEHAPTGKRGFYGAWVQLGAPAGFVMPLGIFSILTYSLSDADFLAWGWRIPFLLSILLVGVGMYIRLSLSESPLFQKQRAQNARQKHPLVELLQTFRRQVVLGCGMKIAESTLFTGYAVLVVAYATNRGIPRPTMTMVTLIAILIELPTLLMFGALSDRLGRRPVYMFGALMGALVTVPLFSMIYTGNTEFLWLAFIGVLSIAHSAMYGPQAAFTSEMFPTHIRASGVSFVQQIGALIGSVGALGAGWLLQLDAGAPWYLCAYIIGCCAITLVCTWMLQETNTRSLS